MRFLIPAVLAMSAATASAQLRTSDVLSFDADSAHFDVRANSYGYVVIDGAKGVLKVSVNLTTIEARDFGRRLRAMADSLVKADPAKELLFEEFAPRKTSSRASVNVSRRQTAGKSRFRIEIADRNAVADFRVPASRATILNLSSAMGRAADIVNIMKPGTDSVWSKIDGIRTTPRPRP